MSDTDLITVCDRCLCATCWHGIFMCDEAYLAGVIQKPRAELVALGREHPEHLRTDAQIGAECLLVSRKSRFEAPRRP